MADDQPEQEQQGGEELERVPTTHSGPHKIWTPKIMAGLGKRLVEWMEAGPERILVNAFCFQCKPRISPGVLSAKVGKPGYEEFSELYAVARSMAEERLFRLAAFRDVVSQNGGNPTSRIDPRFAQFCLSAHFGWREKTEQAVSSKVELFGNGLHVVVDGRDQGQAG